MRKLNKPSKANKVANNLGSYFNNYDRATLVGLLNALENSEAWGIFRAYAEVVQRRYEIEALDLMGKEGAVKSAAFASGYAKGVEDVHTKFMEGVKNTVLNVSMAVEDPRPEEVEEEV